MESDYIDRTDERVGSLIIEKLDKIYCCMGCRAVYLFISDIAEHQEDTGHRTKFYEVPLE